MAAQRRAGAARAKCAYLCGENKIGRSAGTPLIEWSLRCSLHPGSAHRDRDRWTGAGTALWVWRHGTLFFRKSHMSAVEPSHHLAHDLGLSRSFAVVPRLRRPRSHRRRRERAAHGTLATRTARHASRANAACVGRTAGVASPLPAGVACPQSPPRRVHVPRWPIVSPGPASTHSQLREPTLDSIVHSVDNPADPRTHNIGPAPSYGRPRHRAGSARQGGHAFTMQHLSLGTLGVHAAGV